MQAAVVCNFMSHCKQQPYVVYVCVYSWHVDAHTLLFACCLLPTAFAQTLTLAVCTQLLSLAQALKQLESKQQAIVEKAAGKVCSSVTGAVGSDSRPPLVTRHAPNQQPSLLDQQQRPALQQQPSQVCATDEG